MCSASGSSRAQVMNAKMPRTDAEWEANNGAQG